MSKSEFFHPTIVPWALLLGQSEGQNIRNSPFPVTIISFSSGSKRASPPQLLAGGYPDDRRSWMLDVMLNTVLEALGNLHTRYVSRAAIRSIGKMKRKKNRDKIANPFAALVYHLSV